MAKKISLETLDTRFAKLEVLIERGFGAPVSEMATKDQVVALHMQINAIETQLRGMKHVKLEGRVADLEQKVSAMYGCRRSP